MVREHPPNPYRKEAYPDLYSAWEDGFQASLSGEPVPEQRRESPSEASIAWLNGYTAARLSGASSAQSGETPLE